MKEKVKNILIKQGNNPQEVDEMINANFDFAITKYNTASKVAKYLRVVF